MPLEANCSLATLTPGARCQGMTLKDRLERFERTNIEAAAVIEAERLARDAKTAKLREARLAAEARQEEDKPKRARVRDTG